MLFQTDGFLLRLTRRRVATLWGRLQNVFVAPTVFPVVVFLAVVLTAATVFPEENDVVGRSTVQVPNITSHTSSVGVAKLPRRNVDVSPLLADAHRHVLAIDNPCKKAEYLANLAVLMEQSGNLEAVKGMLKLAVELASTDEAQQKSPILLGSIAEHSARVGQIDYAQTVLALRTNCTSVYSWELRFKSGFIQAAIAYCYERSGQVDQARSIVDKQSSVDLKLFGLRELALAQWRLNDRATATQTLQEATKMARALSDDDGRVWELAYVVRAYSEMGRIKQAKRLLDELQTITKAKAKLDPDDDLIGYNVVQVSAELGDVEWVRKYDAASRARWKRRRLREAIKSLGQGDTRSFRQHLYHSIQGEYFQLSFTELAEAYCRSGDFESALELTELPKHPDELNSINREVGYQLIDSGHLAKARLVSERLTDEHQKLDLLIQISAKYQTRGETVEAKTTLTSALDLARKMMRADPEYPYWDFRALAEVHARAGLQERMMKFVDEIPYPATKASILMGVADGLMPGTIAPYQLEK